MHSEQDWLMPVVHPVYARLICADLRRKGFTERQILSGTHLQWQALHTDNSFLSFAQIRRLVLRALALSECPWLGLKVGASTQLSTHGALGVAVMACSNVAQALQLLQRFASLREGLAVVSVECQEHLVLVFHEQLQAPDIREYVMGHLTAGLLCLLETISGQDLRRQAKISWPFAEPAWAHVYRECSAQLEFDAPQLRIELPLTLLNQANLAADPEAYRLALRDCEQQLKHQQLGSLSQRVQQRLLACAGQYPSLAQMAATEYIAPRTLIRHLRDEGVNYQQLLDHVRAELACWLLLQTPLSIEAIAERLGYQDSSNFSRTFRRWLGVTPRAYRLGEQAEV
jgi:AraC-like DNA-binding protein